MQATKSTPHRCLWSALERLGLWESYLQRGATQASESGGAFGLRWNPRVDLLKVPDRPGVFVLFFQNKRLIVGEADNVFRALVQHYRSPGMRMHAFSWAACAHEMERQILAERWQQLGYDGCWELETL